MTIKAWNFRPQRRPVISQQKSPQYVSKKDVSVIPDETDGGAVIISVKRGIYHGLNATAYFLWNALTSGRTVDEATSLYMADFAVPRDTAERDIRLIIDQLTQRRLINVAEG